MTIVVKSRQHNCISFTLASNDFLMHEFDPSWRPIYKTIQIFVKL